MVYMVSHASVGYTIMRKTADWIDVHKTVIDTLDKEGKCLLLKKLVIY